MGNNVAALSLEDVNRLVRDPSPATRAGTVEKLAAHFNPNDLSPSELKLAEDIVRLMVKDAEVRVREALSASLKHNLLLPHDVAVALARDVDSVALPVLSVSEVLTADDLVEIVHSRGSAARMDAIAGRRVVDARVSAAIVDKGAESTVAKLLANPGADLNEPTLHKVVDKFGDSPAVQEPLVMRGTLPVTVAERLVTYVAEHLRVHLLSHHKISADLALDLIMQSRERATVGLAMGVSEAGLAALVQQLKSHKRLTGSLVLRAICMGNMRFFEHAVAALAGVPVGNARILVHDAGRRGLTTVWERAGLPASFLPAVHAAIDVVVEVERDGLDLDPARTSQRIIQRVLTQYEVLGVSFEDDDLEYLLARVTQLPPASVRMH